MKKALSILLSLLIAFSMFSSMSFSSFAAAQDTFEYTINDDKVTITGLTEDSYDSYVGELEIPETIDGYNVVEIGEYAFQYAEYISSIAIPATVTKIGEGAFISCGSLKNIYVDEANEYYSSVDGVLFDEEKTAIIRYPQTNHRTSYTIPDTVTTIEKMAFMDVADLETVTFPESLEYINESAFLRCVGLTEVTIPENVIIIDKYAFSDCTQIATLTVEDAQVDIEEYAFTFCTGLKSIDLGNYAMSLGYEAFSYCYELDRIKLPESLTIIGTYAFKETAYYNDPENWDNGVFYIGEHLVETNSVDMVYEIKEGTKIINWGTFCDSNIAVLIIPDSVKVINEGLFSNSQNMWHILYKGTEEQWENVQFYTPNEVLLNTTIHCSADWGFLPETTTKEPSCTEEGEIVYTCAICGESKTLSLSTLDHDLEVVSTKEVNCVETGYKVYGCTSCDYQEKSDYEYFLGHNIENGVCTRCNLAERHCIESEHNYADHCDETWTISEEGALRIAITFSEDTYTEQDYDFIEIYYGDGEFYGRYHGDTLAGKRFVFFTDTVKIRLISDESNTYYGFALSNVEVYNTKCLHKETEIIGKVEAGCTEEGYSGNIHCKSCLALITEGEVIEATGHNYGEDGDCTACGKSVDCYESEHDYQNNYDNTWIINRTGALKIELTFSDTTYTELDYDFIEIYDANNELVDRYSGDQLSGKTITVNSDVVKIRLVTDYSNTFYGFELMKITATYPCQHTNSEIIDARIVTCIHDGYTGNLYCRDCDEIVDFGETLTATGHNYVSGVCTNCKAPEGITYEIIDNKEVSITQYKGNRTSIVIPEKICNLPVTKIDTFAFSYYSSTLVEITLPDTIKEISHYAFINCYALEKINIPKNLEILGNYVFLSCRILESVELPESVKEIGVAVFEDCKSLKTVVLPDNLEVISDYMFSGCYALETINVPSSLKKIGNFAFRNCENFEGFVIPASVDEIGSAPFLGCDLITEYKVDEDNEYFTTDEYGVLFDKYKTILKAYPTDNDRDSYEIPDSVGIIDSYAFNLSWNLKEVIIPEGVYKIRYAAFAYCRELLDIDIPSSVSSISMEAFEGCNKLTSVAFSSSMTLLDDATFSSCNNLRSVVIPSSITEIGSGVFAGCPNLSHILYTGTEAQWNSITMPEAVAESFGNMTIHFNAKGDEIKNLGTIAPTCVNLGFDVCKCSLCAFEFKDNYRNQLGHAFYDADDNCDNCGMHIDDCIESEHYYPTACDDSWTIYKEGATRIDVTFSNQSYTEYADGYDYIKIYDGDGNELGEYYEDQLADKTIVVYSDTVTIRLVSDDNKNEYYGFAVAKIQAYYGEEYGLFTPEGKSTVIDKENKLIYGLVPNLSFYTFLNEYITASGYSLSCDDIILGTGSKIKVQAATGAPAGEYTIIIFGDLNGDGWYDGQDATIVGCLINGMLTKADIGEYACMAADCNHDDSIDAMDYNCLTSAGLMLWEVNQDKTGIGVVPDSEYLELIDQSPETDITPEDTPNEEVDLIAVIINVIMKIVEMIVDYLYGIFM